MEKLVYVLWKPSGRTGGALRDALLGDVAPALLRHGASRISVDVSDEHVAHALGPRIAQLAPPIDGFLTFWLDEAEARRALEPAIAAATSRFFPFLVVESVPLRNTTHVAARGERTPGINMVACIIPKPGMAHADFIRHWHTTHRAVALETQCTYAYVRNEIVRSFAPDAPPWAAVVEEGFPADAVTDPMRWYRADGSEETYKRNFDRMMESCVAFLDLARIESHPMSEYVL